MKYWLSTLPEDAPLQRMVFEAKMRWRIERDYQDLKQELGLGTTKAEAGGVSLTTPA
jgi:SRSO17 transposase